MRFLVIQNYTTQWYSYINLYLDNEKGVAVATPFGRQQMKSYFKTAKIEAVISSTLPVPLTLQYAGAFTLSAALACAAHEE